MLPPVRCFTCGSDLGVKGTVYHKIRKRRVLGGLADPGPEGLEAEPAQASAAPAKRPGSTVGGERESLMADILGKFELRGCCRQHVVETQVLSDWN